MEISLNSTGSSKPKLSESRVRDICTFLEQYLVCASWNLEDPSSLMSTMALGKVYRQIVHFD